jgi:sodium/hydrogen antiporter
VHGSGFLAAFAAGITIAALDVELCDCFVEYGAVTAEMFLLFTFVLLGGSLIWTGFTVISGPTLLFTAIAVLIRTPVYLLSLIGSGVHRRGRLLIAWYGPRGLSSLLLILLPVFAGMPGSDQLFAVCSLVVLVSVVVHGGSPMLLARLARRRALREGLVTSLPPGFTREELHSIAKSPAVAAPESEEVASAAKIDASDEIDVGSQTISIDELTRLWRANEPVVILDVRTERSIEDSDTQAKGAVRLSPEDLVHEARRLGLDPEAWLIAYCA